MMSFRFVITPVLSLVPIGELELSGVSWNDPVFGPGGSFTGKAEINNVQTRDRLKQFTEPDQVALYVQDTETNQYLFGGPVVDNPWNRGEQRLVVTAQSWKSWMYQKLVQMNMSTNPVAEISYTQTAKDQFFIARYLITNTINVDVGCPVINLGTELSGVIRDLSVKGSDMKYVADMIDSMANRDNGFEWEIQVRPSNSGDPSLWFAPSFPARGGVNNQVLLLHQMKTGGNILAMDDPQNSSAERRSRVWTTGTGQPPDQPVAFDQDPAIVSDFLLLREQVTNYNSVAKISTLADHARAERLYRNHTLQQVQIEVALDDPDFRVYAAGDKVRLLVEDPWVNWDFDSVRIISRTFLVNDGSNNNVDRVKLLIDLNDTQLPENTTVI
jgi:hypothetical protein